MDVQVSGELERYVAEEIRVVLTRRRLSLSWLAGKLGWSSSQLSRKLSNQASISVDDLGHMAKTLGLYIGDLLPKRGDVNYPDRASKQIVTLTNYLSMVRV